MQPGGRAVLGPAEVTDDELAGLVAVQLGVRRATIVTSSADVVPAGPAITTAGRYRVTGTARADSGEIRPFAFFVKVIQSYQRSTLRLAVPEHLREQAAALISWRAEADVYRGNLRDRLPYGLTMPRAAMVRDLDGAPRGSAYDGSNPSSATTCGNGPLAANSRASGSFLLCPSVCHLVAL